MHEMALVRDVVDVVLARAQEAQVDSVKVVYLTIGDARDIVIEYFEGLFRHLARGTVAQDAEIIISSSPFMVKCNQCGMVYHIDVRDSVTWPCPECTARDYHVHSGMEFMIDGIEVETHEHDAGELEPNYETVAHAKERQSQEAAGQAA